MVSNARILIVEDEALIAENLRYSLEDLGYQVVGICHNFEQAYIAINQVQFDIVMLDISLGDSSLNQRGFDLAQIIKAKYDVPIIFITAYNDIETFKVASKFAPYGYLVKPVNNAMLFATIQLSIERFNNKTVVQGAYEQENEPEYFFIKIGKKTQKVLWSDIYCIEAGKNYVSLRSKANNVAYPMRGSLTKVMETLLPPQLRKAFIKVNRKVYINKSFITAFDKQFVYCQDEKFVNSLKDLPDHLQS